MWDSPAGEPDHEAVFATAEEKTATKECGAARESQ